LAMFNNFTPHMVEARWSRKYGWQRAELTSHSALNLAPSAMVLHYGQAIFEGLKAYPRADGSGSMFRLCRCAARFNRSAARMAMPVMPEDSFIEACELLVRADIEQVPTAPGNSLYLRPFMIATEASIELRASDEFLFGIIAAPFSMSATSMSGIGVWCPENHIRAAVGGTGEAKCAGNYAGSFIGKAEAIRHGCHEVLWLDAVERRWVEELSGMNLFCVSRSPDGTIELATPPLAGTILDGHTRNSLLRLAARCGVRTAERPVELAEITHPDRSVIELFACGTAVTVLPITRVVTVRGCHQIADGRPGSLTRQLRGELIAIQEGRAPDEFGWMHDVHPVASDTAAPPSAHRHAVG
jgi:branched-chain amino acid aminotransferase